ncbi:glycosyltransferase family 1 protein [Collybiopsis luxurians FD-317 M1]|nr:glycosyltransferase family 1 protein [Collybiopsis luxurians FD-317 M1]
MLSLRVLSAIALLILTRLFYIRFCAKNHKTKEKSTSSRKLAVFLGSGGHTTEMLALISSLDFEKYFPRTYIVSEGDTLSEQKAVMLERKKAGDSKFSLKDAYSILIIPRARKVHQPLLTTPPTALFSLLQCIYHVTIKPIVYQQNAHPHFADVLVLNGPGTCLILCLAVSFNKFLGLSAPTMFYIESFARVNTLSLSGKLLRFLVDRFIVQWPQLMKKSAKAECHGWLI